MSKIIIIIILVFILFFVFYSKSDTKIIKINNQNFNLETAKTVFQKSRGLMFRKSLCQNCGMLFTFDQPGIYPFWMKNTLIPLDIIWLDSAGIVVDIKTGQPQNTDPLTNSSPAKYVLETNLNATGLKIGDQINL